MNNFTDLLTYILDLKYSKFINKKSNICIHKDCFKYSCFNYINKKISKYCKNHKLHNMVDIRHK
jgi:hypothetical protein